MLPDSERYGLTSQMQRAASSVPANIAEGHGRETSKGFVQFLRIAQGSLKELETHIIIADRISYLNRSVAERLLIQSDEIGRMIYALLEERPDSQEAELHLSTAA